MNLELAGYRIMFLNDAGFRQEPGCERVYIAVPEEKRKWKLVDVALGEAWAARKKWAEENCLPATHYERTVIVEPVFVKVK